MSKGYHFQKICALGNNQPFFKASTPAHFSCHTFYISFPFTFSSPFFVSFVFISTFASSFFLLYKNLYANEKNDKVYLHLRVLGYEKCGQIPRAFNANVKQSVIYRISSNELNLNSILHDLRYIYFDATRSILHNINNL